MPPASRGTRHGGFRQPGGILPISGVGGRGRGVPGGGGGGGGGAAGVRAAGIWCRSIGSTYSGMLAVLGLLVMGSVWLSSEVQKEGNVTVSQ